MSRTEMMLRVLRALQVIARSHQMTLEMMTIRVRERAFRSAHIGHERCHHVVQQSDLLGGAHGD